MINVRGQNRFILFLTLISFLATSVFSNISLAQEVLSLPAVGTQLTLTSKFNPPIIKGITLYPKNPLQFDFIVSQGEEKLNDQQLREASLRMIKYFLASLTIPNKEMWVNLSPYEKNRIVAPGLGQTEMGRDLLAEDYMLKQLTASVMHPEHEVGKKFWEKIYKQAQEKYGTTDIPVNTFNKVWIVPDKAVVYEHGQSAFVVERHLKVMLEEDYLSLKKHTSIQSVIASEAKQSFQTHTIASKIIKQIILPALEKEVNEGKTFANLRQVYNAMILATWYKKNLRESLLAKVYADKNKTRGVDGDDKEVAQKIYNQYLKSFKKGVYNFIKEECDPTTQQVIPRKYFAGGVLGIEQAQLVTVRGNLAMLSKKQDAELLGDTSKNLTMTVRITEIGKGTDAAALARVKNQEAGKSGAVDKASLATALRREIVRLRNETKDPGLVESYYKSLVENLHLDIDRTSMTQQQIKDAIKHAVSIFLMQIIQNVSSAKIINDQFSGVWDPLTYSLADRFSKDGTQFDEKSIRLDPDSDYQATKAFMNAMADSLEVLMLQELLLSGSKPGPSDAAMAGRLNRRLLLAGIAGGAGLMMAGYDHIVFADANSARVRFPTKPGQPDRFFDLPMDQEMIPILVRLFEELLASNPTEKQLKDWVGILNNIWLRYSKVRNDDMSYYLIYLQIPFNELAKKYKSLYLILTKDPTTTHETGGLVFGLYKILSSQSLDTPGRINYELQSVGSSPHGEHHRGANSIDSGFTYVLLSEINRGYESYKKMTILLDQEGKKVRFTPDFQGQLVRAQATFAKASLNGKAIPSQEEYRQKVKQRVLRHERDHQDRSYPLAQRILGDLNKKSLSQQIKNFKRWIKIHDLLAHMEETLAHTGDIMAEGQGAVWNKLFEASDWFAMAMIMGVPRYMDSIKDVDRSNKYDKKQILKFFSRELTPTDIQEIQRSWISLAQDVAAGEDKKQAQEKAILERIKFVNTKVKILWDAAVSNAAMVGKGKEVAELERQELGVTQSDKAMTGKSAKLGSASIAEAGFDDSEETEFLRPIKFSDIPKMSDEVLLGALKGNRGFDGVQITDETAPGYLKIIRQALEESRNAFQSVNNLRGILNRDKQSPSDPRPQLADILLREHTRIRITMQNLAQAKRLSVARSQSLYSLVGQLKKSPHRLRRIIKQLKNRDDLIPAQVDASVKVLENLVRRLESGELGEERAWRTGVGAAMGIIQQYPKLNTVLAHLVNEELTAFERAPTVMLQEPEPITRVNTPAVSTDFFDEKGQKTRLIAEKTQGPLTRTREDNERALPRAPSERIAEKTGIAPNPITRTNTTVSEPPEFHPEHRGKKKDRAMTSDHIGGIDLNADLLNLQIKRDSRGVALPLAQQSLDQIKIDGFLPIIIQIKPINLQELLG